MPHWKTAIRKLLPAVSLLFTALPVMAAADKVIDATKAGVVGDGATLNTVRIQKAIDDCATAGGCTIRFPAGRYLTGTIQIKSNVTLRLEKEATLLGSTETADYLNLDPFIDGSGNPMGHALIVALDADHVGVEGRGTVDGQGVQLKANQNPYTMRPFLLRWVRCTNVTVRDVHLTNPGAWTLNFFQTKGALVERVTIRARGTGLHNNDGINIDSSENVRVRNCDVNSGDDALVIKSTSATKPSRDIVASDCKLSTRTNAIKLGTESIGGFENISISNCQISNTQMAGIALYEVDGGDLRNVTITDVTMDGVIVPISIRLGARLKTFREGDRPKPTAGKLRDVTIKNVSAKNIEMIGMLINGVPGHPVEALTLKNIQLELPGGGTAEGAKVQLPEKESAYPEFEMFGKTMPAYGIYARHLRGMKLQQVRTSLLKPDARPATVFIDVEDVDTATLVSLAPRAAHASTPLRVVLIGDSTVCDYPATHTNRGWGQFIEERFKDGAVKVINLAAAGRSTKTFIQEGRWQKALEEKPDYVLIQFGHNDSHAPDKPESTDAATDYKDYLRRYIVESRAIGATPILVTPMVRRTFDAQGKITESQPPPNRSLLFYVNAMREVGSERKVAVIDLHASSQALAEKLGPDASAEMANQKGDVTHFNEKGARAMADLVMRELPTAEPKLKEYLKAP